MKFEGGIKNKQFLHRSTFGHSPSLKWHLNGSINILKSLNQLFPENVSITLFTVWVSVSVHLRWRRTLWGSIRQRPIKPYVKKTIHSEWLQMQTIGYYAIMAVSITIDRRNLLFLKILNMCISRHWLCGMCLR